MTIEALLPTALLLTSLVAGVAIFLLPEERAKVRSAIGLTAAVVNLLLAAFVLLAVAQGTVLEARLPIAPGFDLLLRLDALAILFVTLSSGLWLLTTVYAIGYLGGGQDARRFFGFFSLCISATAGVAMAGSLFTFLIFYEALTLFTYPLVAHYGTRKALRAGTIYFAYMLPSSSLMFAGIVWLYVVLGGDPDFSEAPRLVAEALAGHRTELTVIFFMIATGMAAKAAIVPLHGWLPEAMVAPAPVSALLHAVAVVKAGAFGLIRLVHDVYGGAAFELGLAPWLAAAAAVTILYGSLRALVEDDLKRRLAFSTISQLSYIALGTALGGPVALAGAVVHLVHQGTMKITMFFCAGALDHALGVHKVSEMAGAGRRMPWTMTAFSVAALGMIGLPPMAGFISKWYLATGGLAVGQSWVVPLLLTSALLNAAYFLPIVHTAWFHAPPAGAEPMRCEAKASLLVPPLVTAALTLLLGLFAAVPGSPLSWASLIAAREFEP